MNMSSRRAFLLGAEPAEVLSRDEAEVIAKKVLSLAKVPQTVVRVLTTHERNTRFARSDITTARDGFGGEVRITSTIGQRVGQAITQRYDDDGLKAAVAEAEDAASQGPERPTTPAIMPRSFPTPTGLSCESTHATTLEQRAALTGSAIDRAKNYTSAGSLDVNSASNLVMNSVGLAAFCKESHVRFTMTARSQDNTGSGWAGQELFDVEKLVPTEVAARAVDKCERSRNPQGVEPGRYTVILEPAAYAQMVYLMMLNQMGLNLAERGVSGFAKPGGGTKIGLKMIDERLSFVSDPTDPDGPFRPFTNDGVPFERTAWIEDGILRNLSYGFGQSPYGYAEEPGSDFGIANPISVRLAPRADVPLMTTDEMIATCERGIYLTRLSADFAYFRLMLFTGVTRDGAWLIEKGKITQPIKNLRYLDSLMFFLNSLEAVGRPELVPVPRTDIGLKFILPPLRVRDFNFTAMADAV